MKTLLSSFSFLCIVLLFSACSLKPETWQVPQKPEFSGSLSLNEKLQSIEKIDLAGYAGPEDIVFDRVGNLYCGVHASEKDFSDGKILKISPNGQLEIFYNAGSWVAGLHFDKDENLIGLSHSEGLIKIQPNGERTVLARTDAEGRPFLIPNGLDIASNGSIYFSNTSHESAYNLKYGRKLILEMKPQGALYRYDPQTAQVETLIDGTYFGNGVVLSQEEDFLLMTETTKYRILKFWLKGEKKGSTEILMDNLPGFPNGISIRKDGTFWLGFTTIRNDALDKIHPKKSMKKLVYTLPEFMQPKQDLFGMVLNISKEGKVLQALYDPSGEWVPEAGAVKEHNSKLYLGGDVVPYISTYDLRKRMSRK